MTALVRSNHQKFIAEQLDPELAARIENTPATGDGAADNTDAPSSESSKTDDEIIKEVTGCISLLCPTLLKVSYLLIVRFSLVLVQIKDEPESSIFEEIRPDQNSDQTCWMPIQLQCVQLFTAKTNLSTFLCSNSLMRVSTIVA